MELSKFKKIFDRKRNPEPISFAEDFIGDGSLNQPYECKRSTGESPAQNFSRLLSLVLKESGKGFQTPDFHFKVNSCTYLISCKNTTVTLINDEQPQIGLGPELSVKLSGTLNNTLMTS